ncbi:Ribonuclease P protein subunit p30 [Phlyctochytrium planicorne]|nr:Ribonuclease P protein subunit p30 [Phlyctochytrium planicorne]
MHDLGVVALTTPTSEPAAAALIQKLGYTIVAANTIIHGKSLNQQNFNVKDAPDQGDLKEIISQGTSKRRTGLTRLRRLTVIVDDTCLNVQINSTSSKLKPFDILAVRPTTEKAFHLACSQLEIDIISFDMTLRMPFFFKATTLNAAIQRGIVFEICYGPAIRETNARRFTIANSNALLRVVKHNHVILSSEALTDMDLRGPYDVINLASLFALNNDQAKHCLTTSCRHVLYHAAARKETYKSVLSQEPDQAVLETQAWKLGEAPNKKGKLDPDAFKEDFITFGENDDDVGDGMAVDV